MITIFSLPKPFTNKHIATIQHNAIKSWMQLEPRPQIILFGRDEGVEEAARELNIEHNNDITYTSLGTPYLNSTFEKARKLAKHHTLVYLNADIILPPDFIKKCLDIKFKKYLMVGHRWNLDVTEKINFSQKDWFDALFKQAKTVNNKSGRGGSDYFVYTRNCIKKFPPFAVGRIAWDNFIIYYFRKKHIPVIDASSLIHVIHQNHDYSHVKNSNGELYLGQESDKNLEIFKSEFQRFTLDDASHYASNHGEIKKIQPLEHFLNRKDFFREISPFRYKVFSIYAKAQKKMNKSPFK